MTVMEEDQVLGGAVQRTRQVLELLLEPSERKTTRAVGSKPPLTFEDKARAISESDDPRAIKVWDALADFQEAVNAFWIVAIEREIPERGVRSWIDSTQAVFLERGATFEDAVSEANFMLRHMITKYNPTKNATLHTYSSRGIWRALNTWYSRLHAPVEVPEKVAKDADISVDRAKLEEHSDYKEDDYED